MMNITLANYWQLFISGLLKSGDYKNRDQLIEEALKALEEKRIHALKTEKLKEDLQKGIDSLDQGRGIVADNRFYEKVIERGQKRLAKLNA
jgi:putative addiction module CopG family antidote